MSDDPDHRIIVRIIEELAEACYEGLETLAKSTTPSGHENSVRRLDLPLKIYAGAVAARNVSHGFTSSSSNLGIFQSMVGEQRFKNEYRRHFDGMKRYARRQERDHMPVELDEDVAILTELAEALLSSIDSHLDEGPRRVTSLRRSNVGDRSNFVRTEHRWLSERTRKDIDEARQTLNELKDRRRRHTENASISTLPKRKVVLSNDLNDRVRRTSKLPQRNSSTASRP